jgi:hypothetical protein
LDHGTFLDYLQLNHVESPTSLGVKTMVKTMVKTIVKTMDSLHSSSENWNPKKASSAWTSTVPLAHGQHGFWPRQAACGYRNGPGSRRVDPFFLGDGLTRALTLW